MKAELINRNGNICVQINGKVYPFSAMRSFRPSAVYHRAFSESGVHFFQIFPSGIMTALQQRTVPYSQFGPVWTGIGKYNWDHLKAQCDLVFSSIAPEDYVSLCVHLDPPQWYVDSHPGFSDHWEQMHNNIASKEWQNDAADYMRALIDKVEEWYPERVYMILLYCGGTTEWYSYHWDTVIEKPSGIQQQAYRTWMRDENASIPPVSVLHHASDGLFRHPVYDKAALDYWHFYGDIVLQAQYFFAHEAKAHTRGEKLVGLFNSHIYGQHLEASVRTAYNNLEYLLACPDIDVIIAPASYTLRRLDASSSIRTPVDSITFGGKLYIHEVDTSTNLTNSNHDNGKDAQAAKQHGAGRDEPFTEIRGVIAYLRREIGISMAKGQGCWFFDMFGGYYDNPEIMREIASLQRLHEQLITRDCSRVSRVIAMLDRESNYYIRTRSYYPNRGDVQCGVFNNMAAPWDQSDTFALFMPAFDENRYSLYVFPALFAPSGKICEKITALRARGKNMLWIHAPGYITPSGFSTDAMEKLTGICFEREKIQDNTAVGTGSLRGLTFSMNNATVPGDIWRNPDPPQQIFPVFSASNLDVIFAVFRENGRPAAGIRFRKDGGFDAYCAVAPFPEEILDLVYRYAKIFRYADARMPVYTNRGFECVYSYEDAVRTLYRPEESLLTDYETGEEIRVGPEGTKIRFRRHETKLFTVKPL